jgi:hypothetical protein
MIMLNINAFEGIFLFNNIEIGHKISVAIGLGGRTTGRSMYVRGYEFKRY